jgi:magnesium chelatase family protein
MASKIWTVAFQGIDTLDVEVQVQMTNGNLSSFAIVRLADKAAGESRERI